VFEVAIDHLAHGWKIQICSIEPRRCRAAGCRAYFLLKMAISREECAKRQASSISFSGVIYAHQMRITIDQSIRDLKLVGKV